SAGKPMRLEPVYLLAPEPEKRGISRRTALLCCLGAFVSGSGLGILGSRAYGAARTGSKPGAAARWAAWLATLEGCSDTELLEQWQAITQFARVEGHAATAIWQPLERLVTLAVDSDRVDRDVRQRMARRIS